ncbi:MAG: NAD-dependent protein deacylase [Euryarchaeota archaeon]|nr:NAD-dependent protein deacylase [Euryarchaeota archaeon]
MIGMIAKNTRVVVLTGAGISAESGIRTFRASDGLWEEHRIEDVATPQGWRDNPQLVWSFYQQRRRQLLEVEPNPGHIALAELERYLDDFLLVTQNVDDLHERAGSNNLIHMHGELEKLRCEDCGHIEAMMDEEHLTDVFVACTNCGSRLRPHIVWFGEIPLQTHEIENALSQCDVFIAIGTSGHVYPASNYLHKASMHGARTICINLDPPENIEFFNDFFQGKSGELLPELVEQWIKDSTVE